MLIQPIPVIQQPSRSLRCPRRNPRRGVHLNRRPIRRLVARNQALRLHDRLKELDAAHDDALKRIPAYRWQSRLAGRLAGDRREALGIQRIARHWPDVIRASVGPMSLQGIRMRHLLFEEMPLDLVDINVQSRARDDSPLVHRILLGMTECDKLVVLLERRKRERGHPADRLQRRVLRPGEPLTKRAQRLRRRHDVEAADLHVDGMDLPSPDAGHQVVPQLLQGQSALDDLRMGLGHLQRVVVAQKIRGVQQIDVQRVAFDPLPAVQQPAQIPQWSVHRDAGQPLHRMRGAHLIGHRTDAADTRRDIRGLGEVAAPQKGFEKSRRLKDLELDIDELIPPDLHHQRALAFHPGEHVDADRLRVHPYTLRRSSDDALRNGWAAALNVRYACRIRSSPTPSLRHCWLREDGFGLSIGPKQP